jgi:hypothetical protein
MKQHELENRHSPLVVNFRSFGAGMFEAWGSIVR